jgi:Mg/Co/Ni transporter MgtE
MSLTKLTENLNKVSSLPDKPTLQPDELKAVFDNAGNAIKNYINEVLTEEIEKLVSDTAKTTKTTVENALDSDSVINALSSAQGKALKGLVDNLDKNKQKKISISTKEPTGGTSGDIHIQYFN